jgi:Ca2+-binding EF-hand superfamily protein
MTEQPPYSLQYLRTRFQCDKGRQVDAKDPEFSRVIQSLFTYYDDGTGFMGELRLGVVARDLGDDAAYDTDAVKQMFREMDTDRSGMLDPDEFIEAMAVFVNRGYVITDPATEVPPPPPEDELEDDPNLPTPPYTLEFLRNHFNVSFSNENTVRASEATFSRMIKRLFKYYDDGTGFMGELRLGVVARDLGDDAAYDTDAVKQMFREMDTDRSGMLDPDEFIEAMAVFVNRGYVMTLPKRKFTLSQLRDMFKVSAYTPVSADNKDFANAIQGMFNYYDDGTGFMGELRLGVVARDLGDDAAYDADAVKQMFREMDTDRSGMLDPEEFLQSMTTFVNRGYCISTSEAEE